jgi:hypothetical protein
MSVGKRWPHWWAIFRCRNIPSFSSNYFAAKDMETRRGGWEGFCDHKIRTPRPLFSTLPVTPLEAGSWSVYTVCRCCYNYELWPFRVLGRSLASCAVVSFSRRVCCSWTWYWSVTVCEWLGCTSVSSIGPTLQFIYISWCTSYQIRLNSSRMWRELCILWPSAGAERC